MPPSTAQLTTRIFSFVSGFLLSDLNLPNSSIKVSLPSSVLIFNTRI